MRWTGGVSKVPLGVGGVGRDLETRDEPSFPGKQDSLYYQPQTLSSFPSCPLISLFPLDTPNPEHLHPSSRLSCLLHLLTSVGPSCLYLTFLFPSYLPRCVSLGHSYPVSFPVQFECKEEDPPRGSLTPFLTPPRLHSPESTLGRGVPPSSPVVEEVYYRKGRPRGDEGWCHIFLSSVDHTTPLPLSPRSQTTDSWLRGKTLVSKGLHREGKAGRV